jgi:LysM repeat protein
MWDMSTGNVNARYEGERLIVNAEAYPSYEIIEKQRCQILDSLVIKKDKEIKREASCVRVYFPKEGDTLWEIAKKYHTTITRLKEQNGISDQALSNVKSIII